MTGTNLPFAWSVALRELRGGLAGFRVFLACLILGVAGIAAVGSLTSATQRGLDAEGQSILGGDAAAIFSYRFANETEQAWLEERGQLSTQVTLRSMLTRGKDRMLSEVKAVDGAYPLYGEATMRGGGTLQDALKIQDGLPGLVTERVIAERMDLKPGDEVK